MTIQITKENEISTKRWLKEQKDLCLGETLYLPSVKLTFKAGDKEAVDRIATLKRTTPNYVKISLAPDNKSATFIGEDSIFYLIRKLCVKEGKIEKVPEKDDQVPFEGAKAYKDRFQKGLEIVDLCGEMNLTSQERFDKVSQLLQEKAYVNARDKMHDTALHNLIISNDVATAQLLLEHGINPNASNRHGDTPLHFFIDFVDDPKIDIAQHMPMLNLLLKHWADTQKKTCEDRVTAFQELEQRLENNPNLAPVLEAFSQSRIKTMHQAGANLSL